MPRLLVIVLLAALLAVALPRLMSKKQAEPGVPAGRTKGAGIEESAPEQYSILLDRIAQTRPKRKVVVIGLDAASWNIIDPMITRGQLPAFASLLQRSSYGDLRSLVLTIQAVDSRDVRVPRIWDMASQAGLKAAVINVPMTYPVNPINGIMMTGMLTDELVLVKQIMPLKGLIKKASEGEIARYRASSYSQPRKVDVRIYGCDVTAYLLDDTNDGTASPTNVLFRVPEFSIDRAPLPGGVDSASVTVPEQTAACGMEQFSPWLKVRIDYNGKPAIGWVRLSPKIAGPAALSVTCTPVYGNAMRSTVPCSYPDSLKAAVAKRFERYTPFVGYAVPTIPDYVDDSVEYLKFFYEYDDWDLFIFQFQATDVIQHWDGDGPYTQDVYMRLDKFLGDFLPRLPDNTVLIVASDHGAREYRFEISLNAWFDSMHLIAKDRTGALDTANSIAFHMYWGIYINEKELERRWKVIPGFEPAKGAPLYDAFVDFLTAKAKNLTYPNGQLATPVTLVKPPKKRALPSPHLIVQPEYADYAVHHEDIFQVGQDMIVTPIQEGKKMHHRRAGMYIVSGPGIKTANKTAAKNIFDIAPTIQRSSVQSGIYSSFSSGSRRRREDAAHGFSGEDATRGFPYRDS
ncbi:MAG: alkaline phosphatase family protein [Chitinivibrionia bacterium]|nr:alkaline phosphatase family protein [Chitinivibrionia bacterium]